MQALTRVVWMVAAYLAASGAAGGIVAVALTIGLQDVQRFDLPTLPYRAVTIGMADLIPISCSCPRRAARAAPG